MLKSVTHLEQALGLWEDHCFYYGKLVQLARAKPRGLVISSPSGLNNQELQQLNIGPFVHSESLRKFLLNSLSNESPFDFDKYIGTQRVRDLLGAKAWLPMSLWAWTRESRRVYQLTRELQLLLGVTSLTGVTWGDLHFPFDSFAIALEDPLTDEESDKQYDLILVSKIVKSNETGSWVDLDFTLFPTQLGGYNKSTLHERNKVTKALRTEKWHQLTHSISKFQRRFSNHGVLGFNFSYSKNKNVPIIAEHWTASDNTPEWSGTYHEGDVLSMTMKATRIVAGLVLYFRSLPPGHSYIKEEAHTAKQKRERLTSPDRACITNAAHVCTVSSSFKLTQEETKALVECKTGAGGYEVRAHFRCGHWRRPPGFGSDPTAERTIWVRPTLVRRDRVGVGTVPGGAETQV